jgi:hypothetical protein
MNLSDLNENKIFVGSVVLLVTFGGRFILGELNEEQKERLTKDKLLRRLIIFGVCFMATRDIVISFIITIAFVLFISELFVSDDPNVKIISVAKDNVKIKEDENKEEDVNKEDSTQIKNKINEAITTLQEIKVSLD